MTQHLCRWYVDMGEDFKPLCKWKHMSPANCKSCPAYQRLLEAENAKLRELIEAILQCACEIKQDKGCDACPMYNEGGSWTDGDACLLRPTLHELGVEVRR